MWLSVDKKNTHLTNQQQICKNLVENLIDQLTSPRGGELC